MHRLFAPMPCLPTAQGEKLRRGGQLPAAIFLRAVCGSTPALRPVLPVRFPAKSAVHFALSSSYRLSLGFSLTQAAVSTQLLWWYCQDAPILNLILISSPCALYVHPLLCA